MNAPARQRETPTRFCSGSFRSAWHSAVLEVRRSRLASSPLRWLLLGALAASPVLAQQPAGGAADQRRLQLLGAMSRENQQAPANQAFLVGFFRRGMQVYLHRLDALSCRSLFGMGDEARFAAAIGSTDGSDRNRIFLDGRGAPSHVPLGPYVFPSDTWSGYYPATAERNTYWHETQHALMDEAGVAIVPGPYGAAMDNATDADDHHAFIEGVGQRGSEAYSELLAFEETVRRADRLESQWLAEGRDPSDYGLQRQAWGDAHQRFSAFLGRMKRLANMPAAALANYRGATGIFFSSSERVAEFYRSGGMKRIDRGETLPIRPPTWVFFPDLLLMPVQVQVLDANRRNLEEAGALATAPSETKNDVFRQSVVVRVMARGAVSRMTGTPQQNLAVGGMVRRGRLRIKVVEDEPLVGLAVSQGTSATADGIIAPGGPSTRYFDIDLAHINAQPVRIAFVRRKLSLLKKPVTYHVSFDFTDPLASRLYDASSAQLGFTLGAGGPATAASATATPAAPAPAAPTASTTSAAGAKSTRTPVGVKVSWGPLPSGLTVFKGSMYDKGRGLGDPPVLSAPDEMELVHGPTAFLQRGDRKANFVIIELYGMVYDRTYASRDEWVSIQFPPGTGKYGPSFDHSETRVAGLRAFESIERKWSERGGQHHYLVELDPQRHLYASILSDMYIHKSGHTDAVDVFTRDVTQFIAGLRFTLPAAQPLTLTKSPALPVPKALTDAPIVDNEIEKRPPPPPVDTTGGRRRRSPAAGGVTPPAATGAPKGTPSTPPAGTTGAGTMSTGTTGAPTAGTGTASTTTTGTGTTGTRTTSAASPQSSPKQAIPPSPSSGTENLALGKATQQSTSGYGGDARRVVDGNSDGTYGSNSVSHTTLQAQPWWQVDLGAIQRIENIRVWNRTDCCVERLSNFYVFVSDSPFTSENLNAIKSQPGVWNYYQGGAAGRTTSVSVNRSGRYVRVQLEGTNYLSLAEVEVYGSADPLSRALLK